MQSLNKSNGVTNFSPHKWMVIRLSNGFCGILPDSTTIEDGDSPGLLSTRYGCFRCSQCSRKTKVFKTENTGWLPYFNGRAFLQSDLQSDQAPTHEALGLDVPHDFRRVLKDFVLKQFPPDVPPSNQMVMWVKDREKYMGRDKEMCNTPPRGVQVSIPIRAST